MAQIRTILNEFEALMNLVNGPIIFTYYAEKELSISTLQYLFIVITQCTGESAR